MRKYLMFLPLLLVTLAVSGCDSLQVQAGFVQPTGAAAVATQAPQPTSTAEPATPTQAPQPTVPDPVVAPPDAGVDAVQAVLDYLGAISERDLARAYKYWDGQGGASGQTYDQFVQGVADTVGISAQVGTPNLAANGSAQTAMVPVTLAAIANAPSDPTGQTVQRYTGTYTLEPRSDGWRIVAADLVEAAAGTEPPADLADPAAVLQAYCDAINQRQFARAFTYWDNLGQASGQTFAQFVAGFATTTHVALQLGEAQMGAGAGNLYASVPASIVATQIDGTVQTYSGTYTLHRANLQPWDQLGWRIQRGDMAPTG